MNRHTLLAASCFVLLASSVASAQVGPNLLNNAAKYTDNGGHIRVTVTAIKGGKVRLGITAPAHVIVDRAEIQQRRLEFADADREPCVPG